MADAALSLPADPPLFSFVIPCYNEHGAIVQTIEQIRRALVNEGNYELAVVDDGSTDGTAELLDKTTQGDSALTVIRHDINKGYGASIKTALHFARAEWIVITDADGTYPSDRIPDLLREARSARQGRGRADGRRCGVSVALPRAEDDSRVLRLRSVRPGDRNHRHNRQSDDLKHECRGHACLMRTTS